MSWFPSIGILLRAASQPLIFWATLTSRLSRMLLPPTLSPCPSLMSIWCWNSSRQKSSSLQLTASSLRNNCSRFCYSSVFVFFFNFSCLIGIPATFEETKRRTAFCITEGGRCDSGKPRVHFSFLIFPNYIFQADLDHVDSVLRQLEKRPSGRCVFLNLNLVWHLNDVPETRFSLY